MEIHVPCIEVWIPLEMTITLYYNAMCHDNMMTIWWTIWWCHDNMMDNMMVSWQYDGQYDDVMTIWWQYDGQYDGQYGDNMMTIWWCHDNVITIWWCHDNVMTIWWTIWWTILWQYDGRYDEPLTFIDNTGGVRAGLAVVVVYVGALDRATAPGAWGTEAPNVAIEGFRSKSIVHLNVSSFYESFLCPICGLSRLKCVSN